MTARIHKPLVPTLLLIATVVLVALTAATGASAAPRATPTELVLWSGGLGPGDDLHGYRLFPDGKLQVLASAGADRADGRVQVVRTLTLRGKPLAELRGAARTAARSPVVSTAESANPSYTSATIRTGRDQKTVLGLNTTPEGLARLVERLDSIAGRAPHPRGRARIVARELPATADCIRGSATRFKRRLSLGEAAEAGAIQLTSKGGFNGDVVAIDADWDKVPAKALVKVEIKIEFIRGAGAPSIEQIEAGIQTRLGGMRTAAGTPVDIDVIPRERLETDPPTPCYHQVRVADDVERSHVSGQVGRPAATPQGGEWTSGDGNDVFAHEALHLAGLEDQYQDFFRSGNREVPIPASVNRVDKAALHAWARSQGLDPKAGFLYGRPKRGHERDIMANLGGAVLDADLMKFVDWVDLVEIHGEAGDVLVTKAKPTETRTGEQNLVVGSDIDLEVERDGHERRDGIVAYCLDHQRDTPRRGTKFDVLGSAADLPHPSMAAVYRIAQAADARQPQELVRTPGAQDAIWRVTDDRSFEGEEESGPATAILAAAGVDGSPDARYDAPHFGNPNADSPGTASVTESGVAAPQLHEPPAPGAASPPPVLTAVEIDRRKVSSGAKGLDSVVTVRATLTDAGDTVRVSLDQVRGRRVRVVKSYGTRTLGAGEQTFSIVLPRKLRPGSYRVTVAGASGERSAALKVLAPRRAGRRATARPAR